MKEGNNKKDINQKATTESKNKSSSSSKSFWKIGIILLLISILISVYGFKNPDFKEKFINLIHETHYIYDENNFNIVHWKFTLNIPSIEEFNSSQISSKSKSIEVPHTWNNLDG